MTMTCPFFFAEILCKDQNYLKLNDTSLQKKKATNCVSLQVSKPQCEGQVTLLKENEVHHLACAIFRKLGEGQYNLLFDFEVEYSACSETFRKKMVKFRVMSRILVVLATKLRWLGIKMLQKVGLSYL